MFCESLESRRLFAATVGLNPSGHAPNENANPVAVLQSGTTGNGATVHVAANNGGYGQAVSHTASNGKSHAGDHGGGNQV